MNDMKKSKPILIVGSIALDTIETSFGRRENIVGGSTTYATVAAGKSAPVHVVGIIGTDFPATGQAIYDQFASDLTDLKVRDGATFRWGGRYHSNGDDRTTLFTELGVFGDFNPQLSSINKSISLVFLANIHPQLQLSVIKQSQPGALIVTDTMNLWIDTTPGELAEVIKRTNVLLINETEAQALGATGDLDQAARRLLDMGPRIVVIKQGSQGAALYEDNNRITIGVFPVRKVIDPTGAGDTFGGGFVAALAGSSDYQEALVNGTALASFCVEGFGIESLVEAQPADIEQRKELLQSTVKA